MTGFWKERPDGWEQHMVDWGNGTKPIVQWFKNSEYVVWKVPSGTHWASLLEPSVSHPGSYLIQKIVEEREDGVLVTEELFEMPVSTRGRRK